MHHLLSISSVLFCLGPSYLFLLWSPPTSIQASILRGFLHMLHHTLERTSRSLTPGHVTALLQTSSGHPKLLVQIPNSLTISLLLLSFSTLLSKNIQRTLYDTESLEFVKIPFCGLNAEWFTFIMRLMYAWKEQCSLIVFIDQDENSLWFFNLGT